MNARQTVKMNPDMMKLAVLSDIHNNLPALQAVARDIALQAPDWVVVAGDFLNRGPSPKRVLEFLGEKEWPLLRGNHEDYVRAQLEMLCAPDAADELLKNPIWQPARWTALQIQESQKCGDALATLPLSATLRAPDDSPVMIVHGTPHANNAGIFDTTSDDELVQMMGMDAPPLLISAHTHASLMRRVNKTLVVNVGATGLPFNGDARAQYGVFTWQNGWHAELRAVEYDREETYRAFETDGFLRDGGPLARVILREVETARPHLGPWVRAFGDEVRAGRLSVAKATELYFAGLA